MITSNDFRPGVTIEIDGQVWQVVEFQHVKPGKGAAFVRAKIKNLETGAVVERTWNAGEKVQEGRVDRRQMQYLYESDGMYVFMDNESYEQIELDKEALGSAVNFLKEEMNASVMMFKGKRCGNGSGNPRRYGDGRQQAGHAGNGVCRKGPPVHQ